MTRDVCVNSAVYEKGPNRAARRAARRPTRRRATRRRAREGPSRVHPDRARASSRRDAGRRETNAATLGKGFAKAAIGMGDGGGDDDDARGRKRARKSRWDTTESDGGADAANASARFGTGSGVVLPDAAAIHAHLASKGVVTANAFRALETDDPETARRYAKYQDVQQRLTMRDFVDERPESDRSPSPPPKYNRFGVKVNTREARMKDKLYRERDELIEWLMANTKPGQFQPPHDWRPRKKERKLYVPEDEYPGYNFIGLILGPRGNTQKRMERETNTRIMLRGKGSVKPGAHRDHKTDYKEDEPLHVVILGETWEGVDAAAEMVGHILRPIDEEANVHKRMQLRELASINGTFVETFGACRFCGVQGHVQANCPEYEKAVSEGYRAPVELVTCKICGNGGHPTRDCPLAGNTEAVGAAKQEMNEEYSAFLNEIGVSKDDLRQGGGAAGAPPMQHQGVGAPQRGNYNARPGDWTCEPCGYSNYASRQFCKRCNETRPGVGGGGAPPLHGGGHHGQQNYGGAPPQFGGGYQQQAPPPRRAPPPPPPIPAGMQVQGGYVVPADVPPPPPEDGSAGMPPPPPPEDGSAGVPPPAMVMQVPPPPVQNVAAVPAPRAVAVPRPHAPIEEPEEGEVGEVPPPPP